VTAADDLEAVRRTWEGHETALVWGRYPVEHDPTRYLERGECSPVMVDYFASPGP